MRNLASTGRTFAEFLVVLMGCARTGEHEYSRCYPIFKRTFMNEQRVRATRNAANCCSVLNINFSYCTTFF